MKTLTWHTKLAIGIAGLSAGTILAMAVGVMAEDTELDSDPRVFPYRGVLELDGESFTGLADFRFTVTDEGGCDFVEEHGDVDVFAGAFAVNIGANTNGGVDDCVFDAQRIFLHIAVRDAQDEGDFTALSGRQRINPVPFAYWAAEGSDLRIDGNLQADSAIINGNVSASSASINGNVSADSASINGNTTSGSLNSGTTTLGTTTINATDFLFGNNPGRGDGGRAMVHFFDDTLNINHEGDFSGGTVIGSELRVQGDVRITGNIADTNSDVVISDDFVVTGASRFRGNITDDQGDVTIDDNLTVTGRTTLGRLYYKSCVFNHEGPHDCPCNEGDLAISGGGIGEAVAEGIRESRPVHFNQTTFGWRLSCYDTTGTDSGAERACDGVWVLCGNVALSGETEIP